MFIQIHMLQSIPPGNLNRDESGQPKKCIFGGVTRGRISSQCLKRSIRHSLEFKKAFSDGLAYRTVYLPRMVANSLRDMNLGITDDELDELMAAIAGCFKKEKRGSDSEDAEEQGEEQVISKSLSSGKSSVDKTGQLVFFPQPYASRIANLVVDFRKENELAYHSFIGRKAKKTLAKAEESLITAEKKQFLQEIANASQSLTVDIGLFGRMTTSDLLVNVEAACQVAHAISTHEIFIERDYFTAMDDLKGTFATTQTESAGAAFLGSGEAETFFSSAVYYKYLNLDLDALRKHLSEMSRENLARVASVLINAAALAIPTGKQNSFAAHGIPEFILIEASEAKRPISYANAFLQPVEGGLGLNLMTESAKALDNYIKSVTTAFAPSGLERRLLAVGGATIAFQFEHQAVDTLADLSKSVVELIIAQGE